MKRIAGAFINFFFNDIITHIPNHWMRHTFLRIFNKKIHSSSRILMHCKIMGFWNVEIGERAIVNQYAVLDCRQYKISIGHDTDIGSYTRIWSLQHDPDSADHGLIGADVYIEDHVWVATSATILPGVRVKSGAVVAAGSTVTKDVEKKSIVAGTPAKEIAKRNNELKYRLRYTPLFD